MTTQTETAPEPDTTYQGWTNYETWAVALWIDNERGDYDRWTSRAQEIADGTRGSLSAYAKFTGREIFTPQERARIALADELREWADEAVPDLGASLWADLLNAALSEVNWGEVADHFLTDVTYPSADAEEESDEA